MNSYNFADIYKSAQFTLEPASMGLRQKSADRFLKAPTFEDGMGLVQIHLGMSVPAFRVRLVELFRTEDATFSIADNDRELVILSTGLLAALIAKGDSDIALALITGSFAGQRKASICPELVEWARTKLYETAVQARERDLSTHIQAPKIQKSKAPAQFDTWPQDPQPAKLVSALKALSQETDASAALAIDYASKAIGAMAHEIRDLREQVEMLWWNVGNHSSQLSKPFSDIAKKAVPILSGLELAGLTRSNVGPVAIGALLQLKLKACEVGKSCKVVDAVNAVAELPVVVPTISDSTVTSKLCPLLSAYGMRVSAGDGSSWAQAFKNQTGFDASTEISALDLAMQSYREALLLKFRKRQ